MYYRAIKCLLISCICVNLNAQQYNYKNWSVSDGLASNEVHSVFLKNKGELYIGTDNGVQVFNGSEFYNIASFDERYSGITAFSIDRMDDGNIWVTSYRNGLFKIINDSLVPFKYNSIIQSQSSSFIAQYYVSPGGTLFYTYYTPGKPFIYTIDISGNLDSISLGYFQDSEKATKYGFKFNESIVLLLSAPDKNLVRNNTKDNGKSFVKYQSDINYFDESFFRRNTFTAVDEDIYVAFNEHIIRYDGKGEITCKYDLEERVIKLINHEGTVYALTFGGVKILPEYCEEITESYLNGMVISDMEWDKEGGIWLSSTENGLYYLASEKIHVAAVNSTLARGNLHQIAAYDNKLLTLDLDSKLRLYTYVDEKYQLVSSFLGFDYQISHYLRLENEEFYLNFTKGIIEDNRFIINNLDNYPQICNDILKLNDSTYLVASNNRGVVKLMHDGSHRLFNQSPSFRFPVYALANYCDSIYVGLKEGLAYFSNGSYKALYSDLISSPVLTLATWNNKLAVGTKGQGLFIVSGKQVRKITTSDGLVSNNIQALATGNGKLWIGTAEGLSVMNSDSEFFNLNEADGLPSNVIRDIAYADGRVNVLTAAGFCYLDTGITKPVENYGISLGLPLYEKIMGPTEFYKLPLGSREIYLNVLTNSLKYNSGFKFKVYYKNDTLEAPDGNISLAGLQPGSHELKVLAGLKGVFPVKEVVFTLVVPAYYYEENWFLALTLIAAVALVSVIIVYSLKQAEFNRITKMKTATAQYEALNLQINPHFLFNSLNNIQFLSSNDPRSRINQFVGKLSKLTRNVLENSKYTTITLLEELENIQRFIDIENIRFQERPIHFNMQVDPKLDLEKLTVPPMIFQPSVENSIWHGLLPKESGDRSLEMKVQEISAGFMVIVSDNGVGWRNKQPKTGTEVNKTSIGLKNTIERLRMYEDMNLGKASLKLEEISNANGEFCGVQVSFLFYPKFILP